MEDDLAKNTFWGIRPDSARTAPIVVGGVILLFVAIIVISVKTFIEANRPRIDLLYAPESAVVLLDGKMVKSGEIVLSAGKHVIRAEKYGFEPEEMDIEVEWGEATPVHFVMTANMEEAKNWYETHTNDGRIADGIIGYRYDSESDEMMRRYPILAKLPIYEEDYYIYQQGCDEPTVCILIDTNEDYFNDAIKYFREELDDDVGNYRFVFYDYSNPFLGEG